MFLRITKIGSGVKIESSSIQEKKTHQIDLVETSCDHGMCWCGAMEFQIV